MALTATRWRLVLESELVVCMLLNSGRKGLESWVVGISHFHIRPLLIMMSYTLVHSEAVLWNSITIGD